MKRPLSAVSPATLSLAIVLLAAAGLLVACGSPSGADHDHDSGQAAGHDAHAGEPDHAGEGQAGEDHHDPDHHAGEAEAALEIAGVRGVTFEPVGAPREEGAWFPAEAVSAPAAEAALSAPVAGRVVAFRAEPGQAVARGAAVVELESPELADLKAAWLTARARREQAAAELARERRLAAAGATAQRAVEAAESAAAVADAEVEAARIALAGRGVAPEEAGSLFTVRSPRAGVVADLAVDLGEMVEAGRRLGLVVAPGAAFVRLELPLPGPEVWASGAETEARRSDGRRWRATVEGTPAALSADTRRLVYRLRLAGDEGLPLAGTPLEVRVPLARAIVLPQEALQQIEGVWGVFVRDGARAGFRTVRKGPELGGDVMVLAGVVPGEEVATGGAYLLKALWIKQAGGGGGHDH